jgi:hypothetical protein
MKTKKKQETPYLNGGEELVLDTLCKHHMLQTPFLVNRVAFRYKVPVWIIKQSLESLIKRGLVLQKGKSLTPKMQPNGAAIITPDIRYENGVKIIKCPAYFASGYARSGWLPEIAYDE